MTDIRSTPRGDVVLVIGATSGIGLATARSLVGRGASVVLMARDHDSLERTASALGPNTIVAQGDVLDPAAVQRAVAAAADRYGRLDAVIMTAQVMAYRRIDDVPRELYERVVDVALHGTANVARTVLPIFRRQNHGTLVVVNSLLGEVAVPRFGSYVAAKWGQLGLVRTLQLETRRDADVHVCLVSPGAVDTPIYRQAANRAGRAGHAPPPVIKPERVAAAAVRCLTHPRRHVEVGPANRLTVLGFRLLPSLFDRAVGPLADMAVFRGLAVPDTDGNVLEPNPHLERLRGGWSRPGRKS